MSSIEGVRDAAPGPLARPRVLVVATWYPSDGRPGDAPFNARHVAAIATFADVRVVHLRLGVREHVRETVEGVLVERMPYGRRMPFASARTLMRLTRLARRADVLHSMAFPAALVMALVPLRRRSWVHSEHWSAVLGGDDQGPAATFARRLVRVLRLPAHVTVVSSSLLAVVERVAKHASVVPNVVPTDAPVPFPTDPPLSLVAVGGLVEIKRPFMAVETLAQLVARGIEARLTWVGDGPLRDALAARADELGVSERLTLTGTIAPGSVRAQLDAAHVFLLPTSKETFLVAGAEAISAGRPVVLGGRGGFVDYVAPENGVIVAEHDAQAYADAVVAVHDRLRDPNAIAATIADRYSLAAVGADFASVYRGVMR